MFKAMGGSNWLFSSSWDIYPLALFSSDLTSPVVVPVQGHWGFPRHALLALLHVLNPMGSHALGDPDLLRGCLFYGLLAAKKPLPEAG